MKSAFAFLQQPKKAKVLKQHLQLFHFIQNSSFSFQKFVSNKKFQKYYLQFFEAEKEIVGTWKPLFGATTITITTPSIRKTTRTLNVKMVKM
jgi:hypothetical protein